MDFTRFIPSWLRRDRLHVTGQVVWLATRDFFRDNGPSWAATIAYYSLLSVFPLLLAVGAVAAYFVDPQWAVSQATQYLEDFIPEGLPAIEEIVRETLTAARQAGIFFFLTLLWTGSLIFHAIIKALNIAYDVEDEHSFLMNIAIRFGMLCTAGLMFLIALASPIALQFLWQTLDILPHGATLLYRIIVGLIPAVVLLIAFFLTYRFAPSRRPNWRAALFGAIVATILFSIARPLFLGYVQQLAEYNMVYGSLSGVVILLFWAWIAAIIGLFGGEISAHAQAIMIEKLSIEEVEQRHLHSRAELREKLEKLQGKE